MQREQLSAAAEDARAGVCAQLKPLCRCRNPFPYGYTIIPGLTPAGQCSLRMFGIEEQIMGIFYGFFSFYTVPKQV